MWPARAYPWLASSVDGIVAGNGDATATKAGTPIMCRRGVEMAAPPLPNAPEQKPTPAPISSVPNKIDKVTT
jgi:hypothetical protein